MRPRRGIYGRVWAHLAPPTYAEVMREAGDNALVDEPTQPAAEHSASESSLPMEVRMQIGYEARTSGVVEIEYDHELTDDELEDRAYLAVLELFPLHVNVDDVETIIERPTDAD